MDQKEADSIQTYLPESLTETPPIWNRFAKARTAVIESLSDENNSELRKSFTEQRFCEFGVYFNDYIVRIEGRKNDIDISMKIRGSIIETFTPDTIAKHQDISTDSRINNSQSVKIEGCFLSKDGKQGYLKIDWSDRRIEQEAYWSECCIQGQKYLRLEQVVTNSGEIIDTGEFDTGWQIKSEKTPQRYEIGRRKVKRIQVPTRYMELPIQDRKSVV